MRLLSNVFVAKHLFIMNIELKLVTSSQINYKYGFFFMKEIL